MRAVTQVLYGLLRGAGGVIEGFEFWGTHPGLIARRLDHAVVAALCVLAAHRLAVAIDHVFPSVVVPSFPWYLVAVEWAWSHLASGLAVAAAAWAAATGYLGLLSIGDTVDAVMSRRGGSPPGSSGVGARRVALIALVLGGGLCAALAYLPVIGPFAAMVLMCPVLGAGIAAATLAARGSSVAAIVRWSRARLPILTGLGAGCLIALVIPVVNLVALPCAAAGAACLVLREERDAGLKTSEGRVPCALPGR